MPISLIWGFLKSGGGKILVFALALSIWTTYQRMDAGTKARASCESSHLKAQIAEQNRQLEVSQKIAQDARARAEEAQTQLTALKGVADGLRKELETRSDADCAIPDDIRRKLRDIK